MSVYRSTTTNVITHQSVTDFENIQQVHDRVCSDKWNELEPDLQSQVLYSVQLSAQRIGAYSVGFTLPLNVRDVCLVDELENVAALAICLKNIASLVKKQKNIDPYYKNRMEDYVYEICFLSKQIQGRVQFKLQMHEFYIMDLLDSALGSTLPNVLIDIIVKY